MANKNDDHKYDNISKIAFIVLLACIGAPIIALVIRLCMWILGV